MTEATNTEIELFREQILTAVKQNESVRIRGNGTKDFYGQSNRGTVLDTTQYCGVIDYDPAELVLSVKCGTTLQEIDEVLASRNQCLPFEAPRYGDSVSPTIGGIVAAGLAGPRRVSAGCVRDFVLGTTLMDGTGEILNFGGRVIKNVAGYDVSRMLAGSLGTLGLLTEVTLKVLPIATVDCTVRFQFNQAESIHITNLWASKPLPVAASVWFEGKLYVRLLGARAAVESAKLVLNGKEMSPQLAEQLWASVRDHKHEFFSKDTSAPLWRVAVPPMSPTLALDGVSQLVEWHGGLRWLRVDDPSEVGVQQIRDTAQELGGHATLFRNGDKSVGVFTPLSRPLMEIHRNLKNKFDPHRVFEPGRMYASI